MKVYFLGTGTSQGIPVIGVDDPVCFSEDPRDKRLRTSALVEWNGIWIQIDCGPDFRQQMLTSKCTKLDAILFTHEHADHTAGLDDIRPYCFARGGGMPVYGQKRVIESLRRRFDYVFETENRYPGAPSVEINYIRPFASFCVEDRKIIPVEVMHGNLPILGYRMENFAYLTDVKYLSDETVDQLQNLEILVMSALRINEHPTHNNLESALGWIQKINPKKTYLTHISYQMGFHREVDKNLPENVFLAYDNLQIEF